MLTEIGSECRAPRSADFPLPLTYPCSSWSIGRDRLIIDAPLRSALFRDRKPIRTKDLHPRHRERRLKHAAPLSTLAHHISPLAHHRKLRSSDQNGANHTPAERGAPRLSNFGAVPRI